MTVYRPQERRLVLRLMAYWDDLRGERGYPPAREIEPATVGDDWAHCVVIEVGQPLAASTFVHIGQALDPQLPEGGERKLESLPADSLLYHATAYLERVLEKRVPMSLGGKATVAGNSVLYRSILLPLSNDGRKIDHVLGAANCRVVADDRTEDPGTHG